MIMSMTGIDSDTLLSFGIISLDGVEAPRLSPTPQRTTIIVVVCCTCQPQRRDLFSSLGYYTPCTPGVSPTPHDERIKVIYITSNTYCR